MDNIKIELKQKKNIKTYKNTTYAIKYNAEMRQITLYDGNQYTVYNSITDLANALEHKSTSYRKVVWCYNLSLMIAYIGEKDFDFVQRQSLKSTIVKYATMFNGDIIFKNLKEYYSKMTLDKIKEMNRIDDSITDEVVITWLSAEKEKSIHENKVSKIKFTKASYVKYELSKEIGVYDFAGIYRNMDQKTHDIIANCKDGGLSGINDVFINQPITVNSYDFKSFYPWIMCTQGFPYRMNYIGPVSIDEFRELVRTKHRHYFIATITFNYIIPKNKSNCRDWLNIQSYNETTITITGLDMGIICNSYDYDIKSVDEFIGFTWINFLPKRVRNFITKQYNVKETFEKNTDEYNIAKIAVNCIYGFFDTDPLKYGKDLNSYSAKRFPFVIGKFVSAYGRYFLWEIMKDHNPIHWDTDGFETADNLNLNNELELNNIKRKISDNKMGKLMCENELAELTVFGNKQYLLNDTLKLSGTNGEKAMEYFNTVLGRKPKAGDTIPGEYTNIVIWDKVNGGGYKLRPFTIGSKFKSN